MSPLLLLYNPLTLIGRKALIRREPEVSVTRGGLVLPAVARERPQIGTIVAIGRRRIGDPTLGSTVMFPKYTDPTSRGVLIEGELLLYLEIDELLCEFHDLPQSQEGES